MESPSSEAAAPSANNNNIYQRNKQLLERFLGGIRSDVTRKGVLYYLHTYMIYHHFYEGEKNSKKKNNNNDIVYRYDLLIGDRDPQTIENMITDFVLVFPFQLITQSTNPLPASDVIVVCVLVRTCSLF